VPVSIQPHARAAERPRYQPSLLSVPSAARTVAPETEGASEANPPRPARRKLWLFVALSGIAGMIGSTALGGNRAVESHVHSGSPGYKHTKTGFDLHWHKKSVTLYLDASLASLGPGGSEAVMQAFGQWVATDARLPDLSFDTTTGSSTPRQDGKSTVSYGRITTPGHERDLAITITYATESTGEIVEADVILNSLYPFGVLSPKAAKQVADSGLLPTKDEQAVSVGTRSGPNEAADCRNRYDAQNVATHEAGHFFGLGEDPIASQAAMFQSIDQCELHKRTLASSDVSAIGTLYAQMADPEEAKVGARACSFGPAPGSPRAFWLPTALFALSWVVRRRKR
jgi:Matrixin